MGLFRAADLVRGSRFFGALDKEAGTSGDVRVGVAHGDAGKVVLNAIFAGMFATVIVEEILARYLAAATHHWYPSPHFALFTGEPFLFAAIYGAVLIHIATAHTLHERGALLALFPISLVVVYLLVGKFFNDRAALVGSAAVGASLVTHAVFFLRDPASRKSRLVQLRAVWILVLAMSTLSFLLELSRTFRPLLDDKLFLFEEGLGIRINAALSLMAIDAPVLKTVLYAIYWTLPAAVALLFQFEKASRERLLVMVAMFGPIAITLYYVFPAVGPGLAFNDYMQQVWTSLVPGSPLLPENPLGQGASTNCMPSEHAVLALLILFNLDETPEPLKSALRVFGVLSLIAIFPIGGHWFTDLVVAVPLAVAEQALISKAGRLWQRARLEAFIVCALLVAAWLWALRVEWFIVASPAVLRWAAILVTQVISLRMLMPLVAGRRAIMVNRLQPAR